MMDVTLALSFGFLLRRRRLRILPFYGQTPPIDEVYREIRPCRRRDDPKSQGREARPQIAGSGQRGVCRRRRLLQRHRPGDGRRGAAGEPRPPEGRGGRLHPPVVPGRAQGGEGRGCRYAGPCWSDVP